MSQTGIGVLSRRLGVNSASAKALRASLGKTIGAATLDDDDILRIRFTDGTTLALRDDGQGCCEYRYMRTDDDLSAFAGARFTGGEIKDAPDQDDGQGDVHEVQFLEIQTDRGVFTMASHNEHNGYYGGFSIKASIE